MKIAVDYSWLGPTGIGRMAAEVLSRKPETAEVIGIRRDMKNAGILTPFSLSSHIKKSCADKFWSPGFIPPALAPSVPNSITIHDLTHLHYFKLHHRVYYNVIIKPLLKNVDVIFTVSDHAKIEIQDWGGISPEKVIRIYNGVDPVFSNNDRSIDISRPYILYVGNRRINKNVSGLMRAFANSGLAKQGFMLALTGSRDAKVAELELELGIEGDVHYFGFVSEADLPAVYRGAHMTAFVSLYEGFGLPIIESMACGTPTLTSSVSCMPEVAGGAALLVDPNDIGSVSEGLKTLCEDGDLRQRLQTAGKQRANEFSWDNTALQYWNVLTQL